MGKYFNKEAVLGVALAIGGATGLATYGAIGLATAHANRKLKKADPKSHEGQYYALQQSLKNPAITRKAYIAQGVAFQTESIKNLQSGKLKARKGQLETIKQQTAEGYFTTKASTQRFSQAYDTYRTKKKLPLI